MDYVVVTAPAPTLASGTVDAVLTAPTPTLSSTISDSVLAVAPVPTLSASMGYDATLTAPVPTLIATLEAYYATLTAPAPTLSATLIAAFTSSFDLPVETLESSLIPGAAIIAEIELPVIQLAAAELLVGHALSAAFQLPVLTLLASLNDGAIFDLPVVTLEATLLSGQVLSGQFDLPVLSFAGTFSSANPFTAAFTLPVVRLSSTVLPGTVSSAAFELPALRATANLLHGTLFTSEPTLLVLTVSSELLSSGLFTAAFALPVTQLSATLLASLAENFRTWVLNTRKGITTEYDWEFVGYAVFNKQVLAVGPAGVVVLGTQALDGASPITARVRVANSDYDTSYLKRVPRIYTGLQQDGDLIFRTISSETGTRSYMLEWLRTEGYTQRRVPVGKGPKSRWWQFEWENVAGADFSIKDLLVFPDAIGRRVQ